MATSAELRALADTMEEIEAAEQDLLSAKGAFVADRSEKNQEWYRNAGDRLAALRAKARNSGIATGSNEPGSATVIAGAAQVGKTPVTEEGDN